MIKLRPIADEIDGIMDGKGNPVSPHVRGRMVLNAMIMELESTGRLFSVDKLPVHLSPNGTIMKLWPGEQSCTDFVLSCGLMTGRDGWDKKLLDALLSLSPTKNKIRGLAHYDEPNHTLFLNEWDSHFIRIGPDGKASRHVNGEFDLLWELANAPHDTDLDLVNAYRGGALAWSDDDLLIKHIFDVGMYSKTSGIGKVNAITILLGFMLALMMKERVKTVPVPLLGGASGSRKSAVAQSIGAVVSGDGMAFRVTACPAAEKEVQNILVNSRGIICLDEFQQPRALESLIKSVTTGGTIRIRVLYTTSKERVFTVDAALFLTINKDPLLDEATTMRFLQIDMGQPDQDARGWRGEIFIVQEWRRDNIRERCWNLVCRLSAAMRLLGQAMEKHEADIVVNHRLSSFWVFLLSIAQQESPECHAQVTAALTAVSDEQKTALGTQDDLLPQMLAWLNAKPEFRRRWMTAPEIGQELSRFWELHTMGRGAGPGLRKILESSFLLSRKLRSSQLYTEQLGLQLGEDKKKHTKTFWFDPPQSGTAEPEMRVNIG
jgi:hypothetical protein